MTTHFFTQPLSTYSLITMTCHLYRKCLLKILPLSLFLIVLYHAFHLGIPYAPASIRPYLNETAMFLWVLTVPLYGAMIVIIDTIAENQPSDYGKAIRFAYQQFLVLFGTLVSMIAIPAIAVGVLLGLGFAIARLKPAIIHDLMALLVQQFGIAGSWAIAGAVIFFILFSLLISKIFALFLIYTDQQDTNGAVDLSQTLVKGYYWRTFGLTLYNVILLIFLCKLAVFMTFFVPQVDIRIWQVLSGLLLAVIGPWTLVLMLAQQYDLQLRQTSIIAVKA